MVVKTAIVERYDQNVLGLLQPNILYWIMEEVWAEQKSLFDGTDLGGFVEVPIGEEGTHEVLISRYDMTRY